METVPDFKKNLLEEFERAFDRLFRDKAEEEIEKLLAAVRSRAREQIAHLCIELHSLIRYDFSGNELRITILDGTKR